MFGHKKENCVGYDDKIPSCSTEPGRWLQGAICAVTVRCKIPASWIVVPITL